MRWRIRPPDRLIPFDEAMAALGKQSLMGERVDDVALRAIVGSVARADDFDVSFRSRDARVRARREQVDRARVTEPVRLVQLGELFFVLDGHHRISLAAHRGQREITARVQQICTVAFAMECLRREHLASKAAEREFLERVPLPDDVRCDLWLDEPADWVRLGDAAEAWAFRTGTSPRPDARIRMAERWWAEEVLPVVTARHGAGRRDVETYVAALAERDRVGTLAWS